MATTMASGVPTEEYCRCCLTEVSDLLFDVFAILEESKGPICELIATICGITITENDETSKNICGDCLRDLVNTFRFRERCLRANQIVQPKPVQDAVVPQVEKCDPELTEENLANAEKATVSKEDKETQTDKVVNVQQNKPKKSFKYYKYRSTFANKHKPSGNFRIHKCPFQCNICWRRFKQPQDLLMHRGSSHLAGDHFGKITLNLNHRGQWF
ncbi:uncharacterized protein LOC134202544 [Armigeres subalbatus]|uniref:uncharacterized protein LOC134202544 n=1 Tax=Armigeres subalbatus TaxID=124917 RepID=UPI002ED09900